MSTDEILTVTRVHGTPGDRYVKCPHCGECVNLPSGPLRGEQFQHEVRHRTWDTTGCRGWFEISSDARLENAE